ncbi:hypothetical protein UCD39_01575 [Nitrospirillum sp. BR 11752]|uniref:ElaB/YqjD/DUF883 family membrane-anchored ribosome-binding protein n=1 Tax=Nitrospirillum amazonense TaxID=28077 RepID=A0A560GVJ3_9PROT|nr:hypothetical protein [Nitrospirillum amazonense]MEE3622679.1 hypothetical protein [Nitrospirillum sp. BR 11752]TWB37584.1 hypothetical protein FBZ90_11471 [Nitrospirillum amazonense]
MASMSIDDVTGKASDIAADTAAAASKVGRTAYDAVREGAYAAADLAKAKGDQAVQEVSTRVAARPLTAIALAGAAGFILARLCSR